MFRKFKRKLEDKYLKVINQLRDENAVLYNRIEAYMYSNYQKGLECENERSNYKRLSAKYDGLVGYYNSLIGSYNELVEEFNVCTAPINKDNQICRLELMLDWLRFQYEEKEYVAICELHKGKWDKLCAEHALIKQRHKLTELSLQDVDTTWTYSVGTTEHTSSCECPSLYYKPKDQAAAIIIEYEKMLDEVLYVHR